MLGTKKPPKSPAGEANEAEPKSLAPKAWALKSPESERDAEENRKGSPWANPPLAERLREGADAGFAENGSKLLPVVVLVGVATGVTKTGGGVKACGTALLTPKLVEGVKEGELNPDVLSLERYSVGSEPFDCNPNVFGICAE